MNERARKQTHQSSSQASNELDELALRQLTVVHRGADAAVRRKVIVLGANLGQLQVLVTKANSATPGEREQLTQQAAPLRHMAEDISAELDSIADGRLRAQAARVTMHAHTLFDQLDALQPPTHEANTSPAREGHEPAAPDQAEAPQAAHPVAPRVTSKQGVAVPRPDYTLEVATKSSVMGHNVALAGQLKFKRTRAVATIAGTAHDESGLALSGKSEALALERKFVIGKVPNGTMGQKLLHALGIAMFKGGGSAGYADLPAKLNWGMDVGGLAQGGKTLSLAKISADLTVSLTDLAEQQHLLPPQSFDIEFTGKVQYEIDAQAAKRLTTALSSLTRAERMARHAERLEREARNLVGFVGELRNKLATLTPSSAEWKYVAAQLKRLERNARTLQATAQVLTKKLRLLQDKVANLAKAATSRIEKLLVSPVAKRAGVLIAKALAKLSPLLLLLDLYDIVAALWALIKHAASFGWGGGGTFQGAQAGGTRESDGIEGTDAKGTHLPTGEGTGASGGARQDGSPVAGATTGATTDNATGHGRNGNDVVGNDAFDNSAHIQAAQDKRRGLGEQQGNSPASKPRPGVPPDAKGNYHKGHAPKPSDGPLPNLDTITDDHHEPIEGDDPTQPRPESEGKSVKAGEPLPPSGSRPGHGDGTDKRKHKPKRKRKGLGTAPHGRRDQAGTPNAAGVAPTRPGPEGPHHAAGQAHRAKDATSPTHGPAADGNVDDPIVAGGHGLTPAFLRSGNISFTSGQLRRWVAITGDAAETSQAGKAWLKAHASSQWKGQRIVHIDAKGQRGADAVGSPGLYRVQLTVITARRGQPQTHTFHFDYYTQAADPARTIAVRSAIDTSPLTALLQSPAPGVYTLPKGTVATLGSVTVEVVKCTKGLASDDAEAVTLVAELLVTQTTGALFLWQGQLVKKSETESETENETLTVELHVTLPRQPG